MRIKTASARPICYSRTALPVIKKERCALREWRPLVLLVNVKASDLSVTCALLKQHQIRSYNPWERPAVWQSMPVHMKQTALLKVGSMYAGVVGFLHALFIGK